MQNEKERALFGNAVKDFTPQVLGTRFDAGGTTRHRTVKPNATIQDDYTQEQHWEDEDSYADRN